MLVALEKANSEKIWGEKGIVSRVLETGSRMKRRYPFQVKNFMSECVKYIRNLANFDLNFNTFRLVTE